MYLLMYFLFFFIALSRKIELALPRSNKETIAYRQSHQRIGMPSSENYTYTHWRKCSTTMIASLLFSSFSSANNTNSMDHIIGSRENTDHGKIMKTNETRDEYFSFPGYTLFMRNLVLFSELGSHKQA